MENKEPKKIYDIALHETLVVPTTVGGKMEITRVPGGWVYTFEFPGFKQSPITFVPFNKEFTSPPKKTSLPDKK